jgi:NitT/TauT family transport system permease protein
MKLFSLQVAFGAAIVIVWQLISGPLVSTFFISKPSEIAVALYDLAVNGNLFYHLGITATEALVGFLIGGLFGVLAGIVLGRAKTTALVVEPYLMAFYSLPKVALAPLFIIWFGIGIDMKIIFSGMIVFFLVFLNTYTGVRQVSREQLTIMRLMGANEYHLITKVIAPSAITWVFAGLRLSVPYSLIGAIVGEIIAANRGIGFLLSDAAAKFDTARVFAALVGIMALAYFLSALVKFVERTLMPWKKAEDLQQMAV